MRGGVQHPNLSLPEKVHRRGGNVSCSGLAGVYGKTPGCALPQGNTVVPTRLNPRPILYCFARTAKNLAQRYAVKRNYVLIAN